MGQIDKGTKRPVTRRSRLLVVRCTQCGVSSHRFRRRVSESGPCACSGQAVRCLAARLASQH